MCISGENEKRVPSVLHNVSKYIKEIKLSLYTDEDT